METQEIVGANAAPLVDVVPDAHKFGLPFILNVPIRRTTTTLGETVGTAATDAKKDAAERTKEEKKRRRTCKHEGYRNYIMHKGLCCRHGGGKKCSLEGCNTSAKHRGLCWKHGGSVACKQNGCDRRPKHAVSAGLTAAAPSAATLKAPKWPCRTGTAGRMAVGNAAATTGALSPRMSARTTCARSISCSCATSTTSMCRWVALPSSHATVTIKWSGLELVLLARSPTTALTIQCVCSSLCRCFASRWGQCAQHCRAEGRLVHKEEK